MKVDTLLKNGNVYTQDDQNPRASAMAVWRDRLVAVGGEEVEGLAGPGTRVIDLGGGTVVPGFCDAHIHWSWTAENMKAVNLYDVPAKEEAVRMIAEAAKTVRPGEWIYGSGWAQGLWGDQFPTAADLDAVAGENPVYLSARSGHAIWVNSLALKLAGITDDTPDPPKGEIQRDKKGRATGILLEEADALVSKHCPPRIPAVVADTVRDAQPEAWKTGLTSMHDYDRPDAFAAYQILHQRGELGIRILKNINDPYIHHAYDLGLRSYLGDDWLRVGGLKMFADGALGAVTARMIEPYEGKPGYHGLYVTEKEELERLALEGTERGFYSTIHAIGDQAVRDVLRLYKKVRAHEARLGIRREERRHRIEHFQLVHPDDASMLGDLGITASIQPIHATNDYEMADRHWGGRARWGYNPHFGLDRGLPVVFGSDAPVEPFDPLVGIHAAVTRRRKDGSPGPEGWYPECRVSVEQAVKCYTKYPAWSAGMENDLGMLKAGCLADLVVLDQDIYTIDPNTLLDVSIRGTMAGGEWRWGEWA